jgi:ketosteroid isomerase-like protein
MRTRGEAAAHGFADAITTCDREAALAVCHPDIEFVSMLEIGGRSYRGHAGIHEYFRDIESAWAEWHVGVELVAEGADGRVAIVMTMRARGKESGLELTDRMAHIWTLRDGRLLRNAFHREPEAALRELGLSPGA